MQHATRLVIGLGIVLALVLPAPAAHACTPPPGGLPSHSVAERVAAAPLVLEGTVVALTDGAVTTATVSVARYFKGSGPAVVTIANFGVGGLCLSQVAPGQRWIFYARGDGRIGLQANYLSQFDAVATPSPEVINQVIAATGRAPRGPDQAWLYVPVLRY